MPKPLDAIRATAVIPVLLILLMASPLLIKFDLPFVQRSLAVDLALATFLILLLAAIPFLIAILVWRIQLWRRQKGETPITALPPH